MDTIPSPPFAGEPTGAPGTFTPSKEWDLHPHGYMIVGVTDRCAIELRKPEGALRIEKAGDPIVVGPEERAQWEARRQHQIRTRSQFMTAEPPPVPRAKPFFRATYGGHDGTVWVRVYQEAERRDPPAETGESDPDAPPPVTWVEPIVFDVFESDGAYLGQVRVPPRTSLLTFSKEALWARLRGEFDESYLVRMRLVAPPP